MILGDCRVQYLNLNTIVEVVCPEDRIFTQLDRRRREDPTGGQSAIYRTSAADLRAQFRKQSLSPRYPTKLGCRAHNTCSLLPICTCPLTIRATATHYERVTNVVPILNASLNGGRQHNGDWADQYKWGCHG